MKTLVFDTESDGLSFEATRLWCISCRCFETGEIKNFGPWELFDGLLYLNTADILVGHNIMQHDFPLIKRLYPWWKPPENKFDTLIASRVFNPDIEGGHSIDAWAKRLKLIKPKHEDWSKYSSEMMVRCSKDTKINLKLYKYFLKEYM